MQEINPPPPKKPQNPENHRAPKIYQLPVQMNTIFKYIVRRADAELATSIYMVHVYDQLGKIILILSPRSSATANTGTHM